MSFDSAYCQELGTSVSAIKANEYYREGKIKSKKAFTCDGSESCEVPLTCANISKPPLEWIKAPYFTNKSNVPHAEDCSYIKRLQNPTTSQSSESASVNKTGLFKIELDENGFIPLKPSDKTSSNKVQGNDLKTRIRSSTSSHSDHVIYQNTDINTLRHLIDIFNSDQFQDIDILYKGNKITITQLFQNIDLQKILTLDVQKVYFGRAKIYERKPEDSYYIVRFEQECIIQIEKVQRAPSFLLFKDKCTTHNLKALTKYVNSDTVLQIYCYGYLKIDERKNKKYIDIEYNNNPNNLYAKKLMK